MKKNFECTIEVKKILNKQEAKRVLKINKTNLVENGGTLHFKGILEHDFVVLVKYKQSIIGYTLLNKSFLYDDDIYVEQVAIDNKFKHLGIGTKMYNYIYKHLKNYKKFTANVNINNKISQDFHSKCGFELSGENEYGLTYVKQVNNDVLMDLSSAQQEIFNI